MRRRGQTARGSNMPIPDRRPSRKSIGDLTQIKSV
jgi:hypothetical protein